MYDPVMAPTATVNEAVTEPLSTLHAGACSSMLGFDERVQAVSLLLKLAPETETGALTTPELGVIDIDGRGLKVEVVAVVVVTCAGASVRRSATATRIMKAANIVPTVIRLLKSEDSTSSP
jgi:hypothetical protein